MWVNISNTNYNESRQPNEYQEPQNPSPLTTFGLEEGRVTKFLLLWGQQHLWVQMIFQIKLCICLNIIMSSRSISRVCTQGRAHHLSSALDCDTNTFKPTAELRSLCFLGEIKVSKPIQWESEWWLTPYSFRSARTDKAIYQDLSEQTWWLSFHTQGKQKSSPGQLVVFVKSSCFMKHMKMLFWHITRWMRFS